MTKDPTPLRDGFMDDDGSGWLDRFLAQEDDFDARARWRLASWGAGAMVAIVVAILATRSPAALNRDQSASSELARQSQQVQWIAKDSQNKARELAAAVETLNGDRDRLYARVTVLEQNLDSVTGALSRQPAPAPAPAAVAQPPQQPIMDAGAIGPPAPAPEAKVETRTEAKAETKPDTVAALPKVAPVASAPSAPAPIKVTEAKSSDAKPVDAKSADAKPDTRSADPKPAASAADAAAEPATTAAINPTDAAPPAMAASTVRRTEFGVDIGGANSIEGLRAVWRGALRINSQHFASLQPIIIVKERNDGFGMQLRLVAGPLTDAAEAAKLCAALTESGRACETAVYEGQRLAMTHEKMPEPATRRVRRRAKAPVAEAPAPAPKTQTSSFGSFFSGK